MYDPENMNKDMIPNNFSEIGHFTQLMWKDTREMGCNEMECPKQMQLPSGEFVQAPGKIITCNYDKGNVGGEFKDQVIWKECPFSKINLP
jgi:hypothetical protein